MMPPEHERERGEHEPAVSVISAKSWGAWKVTRAVELLDVIQEPAGATAVGNGAGGGFCFDQQKRPYTVKRGY